MEDKNQEGLEDWLSQFKGALRETMLAMFWEGRPVSKKWLIDRTGYSDKTINRACKILLEYKLVETRTGRWQLSRKTIDFLLAYFKPRLVRELQRREKSNASNGTNDHSTRQPANTDGKKYQQQQTQTNGTNDHSTRQPANADGKKYQQQQTQPQPNGTYDHSTRQPANADGKKYQQQQTQTNGTNDHSARQPANADGKKLQQPQTQPQPNGTNDHSSPRPTNANGTYDHSSHQPVRSNGKKFHPRRKGIHANGHFDHSSHQQVSADGKKFQQQPVPAQASGTYDHSVRQAIIPPQPQQSPKSLVPQYVEYRWVPPDGPFVPPPPRPPRLNGNNLNPPEKPGSTAENRSQPAQNSPQDRQAGSATQVSASRQDNARPNDQ